MSRSSALLCVSPDLSVALYHPSTYLIYISSLPHIFPFSIPNTVVIYVVCSLMKISCTEQWSWNICFIQTDNCCGCCCNDVCNGCSRFYKI